MGTPVYRFHNRKGRALLPTVLPCVGPVVSLNVITGCSQGCVFCPARRYHPGTPVVYTDLPRQVAEELGRMEARDELPRLVLVGTASDPFGEDSFVRELQFQSMLWILRHGLPLAFRTRGPVGPDFLDLFRRHRAQVHATVVMGAMAPAMQARLEPGTRDQASRLADLQGLLGAGVDARVRLEPLIPFVSDEEARLDPLFADLFRLGVRQVTGVSPTLHPAILADLGPSLGPVLKGLILGAFGLRQLEDLHLRHPQSAGLPIPRQARLLMFQRVKRLAAKHRMAFAPCACNNPDLGGMRCFAGAASEEWARHRQAEMLL
jgi:DNA repair photolyase